MQTAKAAVVQDLKARKVADVHPPYYYHIHLYMPCNQKCIMCVPDGRHPRDFVSIERFEAFVDQIRPYAEHVTLMGGETLLYPWIGEAIDLLADTGLEVTISTNATHLSEPMIEKLLQLPKLNLRCSIDAATRASYLKIRGTDRFDLVTDNMKLYSRMKRGHDGHRQILVYVVMRENLHEVVPFLELARDIQPDRVEYHPVRHVVNWEVDNGTGWHFSGVEQSCEYFTEEYNAVIREAKAAYRQADITCELMELQ